MMAAPPPSNLTFALHPNTRGLGWVVFEGPFSPYDWGLVFTRKDKNATCLRRVEAMLARFTPHTLVLESFEGRSAAPRSERIARLYRAIVSAAIARSIEVVIYTRGEVCACFASVGAHTRHEVAEAVARLIEAFRHRLPKKRQPWETQDHRLALFTAAALVLTHYQLGLSRDIY